MEGSSKDHSTRKTGQGIDKKRTDPGGLSPAYNELDCKGAEW